MRALRPLPQRSGRRARQLLQPKPLDGAEALRERGREAAGEREARVALAAQHEREREVVARDRIVRVARGGRLQVRQRSAVSACAEVEQP